MIDKVNYFPTDKYSKNVAHIEHTINKGKSAICTTNPDGAEIEYAKPADNRSAGSLISYQVDQLPSGAKILIQIK
ncbi:hypothetical protein [Priestia megaterium]|uniref:hypothetical protein n=1 Tax=Priestia megaterium TaxID=1404 RepID=UPI00236363E6|nr:hypothetical protein [Priestia megaterium]MDD1516207.1 hypothetical protein [Priestia megaterium]